MRKPLLIIVAILLVAAIAVTGCNNNQAKVLSVKEVLTNSQIHQGPVTITGIVASVSNDNPKEFAMMDIDDARSNKPGRDIFYLPVISTDRAPKAGVVVKATGQLMEHGLYVAATKVKRCKLKPV